MDRKADLCYTSQINKYVDRKGKNPWLKMTECLKNFFVNDSVFIPLQGAY